jgi:hypothetical protein
VKGNAIEQNWEGFPYKRRESFEAMVFEVSEWRDSDETQEC